MTSLTGARAVRLENNLKKLVEGVTDGRYTTIRTNDGGGMFVTRVPPLGWWWMIPPQPIGALYYKFACKLRVDFAEYISSDGKDLSIEVLDHNHGSLAQRLYSRHKEVVVDNLIETLQG